MSGFSRHPERHLVTTRLTLPEVNELADKIANCPDIMMRLEVDQASEKERWPLVASVQATIDELYATLPSSEDLIEQLHKARNPNESDDPDF